MKDAAVIKCVSIAGSVAIVIAMMMQDGDVALAAAASLLAALSGVGGYAVAASRKVKDV